MVWLFALVNIICYRSTYRRFAAINRHGAEGEAVTGVLFAGHVASVQYGLLCIAGWVAPPVLVLPSLSRPLPKHNQTNKSQLTELE